MSKKKTVVEEVKVMPMPKPEVSNSINLNLNQNDVIEVAIQEYLTILEPKLKEAKIRVNEAAKAVSAKTKEITEEICDNVKSKDVDYFKKICKDNKLDYVFNSSYDYGQNREVLLYKHGQFEQAENYKDPSSWFKRQAHENEMRVQVIERIDGISSVQSDKAFKGPNLSFTMNHLNIQVTDSQKNFYLKQIMPYMQEQIAAYNHLYDTQAEYLEYKYNDKKIKAKVVKESLSRTEEGRGILSLLQSATNVKLLG